jgi:CRP-like cAMP-binding protein
MLIEDLLRVIRESPFFHGMASEDQMSLARLGSADIKPSGGILFEPGDVPSALYLVLDGVVEVSREESSALGMQPVAYLGTGSTLCESKVLTGTTLNALAQFPEGGTILQWPRPILLRQLYSSRALALHYLQSLAKRLEGTIANLGAHAGSNLRGKLDHFDLPAILQTVVDSGASGVFEISDGDGRPFGAIHIRNKMIGPVECGELENSQAFLEILMAPPFNGTFRFSNIETARTTAELRPIQPLLMEAARVQDEFSHFAGTVPHDALLRPASRQLEWTGEAEARLVDAIWHQVSAQPCGWGVLSDLLPYSKGQVALAVRDMLLAGVIAVDRGYEAEAEVDANAAGTV